MPSGALGESLTGGGAARDPWAEADISSGRSSGRLEPTAAPTASLRRSGTGSITDLAATAVGDLYGAGGVSDQYGVRDFEESYGDLIDLSRFLLCLPPGAQGVRSMWRIRLLLLWALLVLHVVVCVLLAGVSFTDVGFGSVGKTNLTDKNEMLKVVTSFDFTSQLIALLTGVLCAWWFFCTREFVRAMLGSSGERRPSSRGSSSGGSKRLDLASIGFGWDFFLSYPGDALAVVSDEVTPQSSRPKSGGGGGSDADAVHEVKVLFSSLGELCRGSNVRYPTGAFLDCEKDLRGWDVQHLLTLHGKSKAMDGPNCPPGPRTGFHIFISYRRRNAADARALKQSLQRFGYRIFMDLDPDGLQSGDFQEQLELVLEDVPVVVMHCCQEPKGEFERINNPNDWVRLEIRKTLEAKKLLIPVFASGNDIGALLSNLPEDCAGLRKLNATELNDGQYEASVNKVHAQIEAKALDLADCVLAEQQEKAVADHWLQHFRMHIEHSSVIVVVVTLGALDAIRIHEHGDRLAATKLLLEWSHALLIAGEQKEQRGWGGDQHLEEPSVIVVPLFLTGHEGDRKPHHDRDTPEQRRIDFANFDSVSSLVDRVLGPADGDADKGMLSPTTTRGGGKPFDRTGFWQEFSDDQPAWFQQQLVPTFSTSASTIHTVDGSGGPLSESNSYRGRSKPPQVDPRSTVQGIFELARTNGLLVNVRDGRVSSVTTPSIGPDGKVLKNANGSLMAVPHRHILQADENVHELVSKELMKMQQVCRDKEHVKFAAELSKPGRRIQAIHGQLVVEARARGEEETVYDDRTDCIGRVKVDHAQLQPLKEAALTCQSQVSRAKLAWPVVCVFAVIWSILTFMDLLAYNNYLDCLVDVTMEECANADEDELTHQLPESEKVIYLAFIVVETVGFLIVLYPLGVINYILFKLDSKFTTALGRRFLAKLKSPAKQLPTDQVFHFEYDNVVVAATTLNFDWGFQLPLLLMLPTLVCSMLWYRIWFQPCAFTMMPSELCADDIACSTFCDQDDPTTPTAESSGPLWHGLLPVVAMGTVLFLMGPLMDFNGRYHVSLGARIQSSIQACSHDQLSHLKDSGGRQQLSSYVRSTAPQMQLFGVALSPIGARFFCVIWLSILLIPFVVFKGAADPLHLRPAI